MSAPLAIGDRDGFRSLVLTRADRGNSLSTDLVEGLHEALAEAERDGVRLLTFEGSGRNFCTGFDLTGLEEVRDGDLLARFVRIEELLARIWSAPFTTLAVAKGRTFGAGADLFAACTVRLALPDSSFSFPGAAFGLVLGTRRLAERIGEEAALSIVTSGQVVDAGRALELGLVTAIVPADELDATIERATRDAARLEATTIAALRRAATAGRAELDRDLAALVRSAARPGLVQRIIDYRAAAQSKKSQDRKEGAVSRSQGGLFQ